MPYHDVTPAEAYSDIARSPALVTRRQLREREARAALAHSASPAPRIPVAENSPAVRSSPKRANLFAAEPSKAASRFRRQRSRGSVAHPTELDVAAMPRSTVTGFRRRMFSKIASIGVMSSVGLILISTTVPANAFIHPVDSSSVSASFKASGAADVTQELTVDAVSAPTVSRDSYTVVSVAQKIQARAGNRVLSYTNNPLGTVQWPFASGVVITSGFGPRNVAGCGFCSTYHQGLDFTPGSGTPIQIVADGVVSSVIVSNSGLGNHVTIDHVINGQKVQSVYAHMQYGSIAVAEGQAVTVGSIVGKVGSTGASTGAHLHFEVHLDETPVDPFAWLQANAN